jgi:hypothetical protein
VGEVLMRSNHIRLVVDKSKKPKINKDCIKGVGFKADKIDFNNFTSGEYYLVPYSVDGFELEGRVFYIYYISFDEKTGVFFTKPPTKVIFTVGVNSVGMDMVLLNGVDGSLVFFGSCWSNTRLFKVYSRFDGEKAVEDYNKDVDTMLSVRDNYLTKIKERELKEILKLKV